MFVSSELDGCDRVRARHFFGFQGRQWVCPLKWLSCVTRYFQETRENVESSYKLAQLGNEKLEDQESFFVPKNQHPFRCIRSQQCTVNSASFGPSKTKISSRMFSDETSSIVWEKPFLCRHGCHDQFKKKQERNDDGKRRHEERHPPVSGVERGPFGDDEHGARGDTQHGGPADLGRRALRPAAGRARLPLRRLRAHQIRSRVPRARGQRQTTGRRFVPLSFLGFLFPFVLFWEQVAVVRCWCWPNRKSWLTLLWKLLVFPFCRNFTASRSILLVFPWFNSVDLIRVNLGNG